MSKAKRGRPQKADSDKRKPAFVVKLTDAENATIREAVGDGKLATWARDVLLRAAKRRINANGDSGN